ncbi:rCG63308 [Rattus norvegicus]|uniref:RCG63308 n=1 Tax=Rattus norvegicus TaxID=10116 RepID=A6JKV7_RAT|nr:rCG63308 [Rattus norvegicus]
MWPPLSTRKLTAALCCPKLISKGEQRVNVKE